MAKTQIKPYKDDSGEVVGVIISVTDGGETRDVRIGADMDGNIEIGGVGPNGSKRGKADPEGNGNSPLGK